MQSSFSIVVLVSGGGSNLQAIIDAIACNQINAHLSAVISNNANAYGLERAKQHNIATHAIDHKQFASREDFDQQLQTVIDQYQPDLVVLAGFMRILTAPFVQHYHGKMLNIHPSLLPAYKGIHTHQRALEEGAKIHGVSVHFVTAELDGGPIIAQARVAVYRDDTEAVLAQRVLKQEHRIYPAVIQWFIEKRLVLVTAKVHFDNTALQQPIIYP
jgi:phosphoribosylglycinamide formyltransferase-1